MTDTPDFSSILKKAIAKIAESEDRAEALRQLMEVIIQLLGAERGFILWKNPTTGELEVQAAHGIDPAQVLNPESTVNSTIINEVVKTSKPLLTTNALADSRFQQQASITGFALRSVVAVPLTVDNETLGVIYCDNRIISGLFQQAELDLIENLVDQVAEAVENLPADVLVDQKAAEAVENLPADTPADQRAVEVGEGISIDGLVGGAVTEEAELEMDGDDADEFGGILDDITKKEAAQSPPKPSRQEIPPEPKPQSVPPPAPQPITAPASTALPNIAPGASAGPTRGFYMDEASTESQGIKFAAYHPREIPPNEWKPLVAYVYRAFAESKISEDAGKQLGPLVTAMRRLTQSAKSLIQEGALITATPILPGFQFNPPSLSMAFYEDWQRFDFKLRAKDAPLHQAANGWITFSVEGVIVGDIPLSIYVSSEAQANVPTTSANNKLYESIFCSYSRQDTVIIERVERAYKALGLEYLRDVESLRSGQHWSDELRALIDKADIFQLFWSPSAADSTYVRMEWEYALNLHRDRANFIRPVYWVKPIPNVPQELSHIHFAYEPGLEA